MPLLLAFALCCTVSCMRCLGGCAGGGAAPLCVRALRGVSGVCAGVHRAAPGDLGVTPRLRFPGRV